MIKKIIIALVLLAAVGYGTQWYLNQQKTVAEEEARRQQRLLAKAELRDIEYKIEVSGNVTPAFEVDIKPEVGGKIKQIYVDTGDVVKKGDVLLEIDDTDLLTEKRSAQTEIEGASLQVERAERNFLRSEKLYQSKLISREIFDNIKSELDIAKNNLQKSESRMEVVEDKLAKTQILAPADGTILTLNVLEGQVVVAAASVNSGTTLMKVADLSRLLIITHVNQIDIAQVKAKSVVPFRSDAFEDLKNEATINFIAPVATVVNSVKGFQVEGLIDNPDPRLKPGMTVTLEIPVATVSNVVSVPVSAIFSDEKKHERVVYVRQGTQTIRRPVEVGLTNLFFAEIINGLQEGEEIMLVKPEISTAASTPENS